jgi:hypothetical protein
MKCVFCGAVKNCAPFLRKVFKNIEQLGSLFEDYAIVLYCDKSFDNSHELLKQYGKINTKLLFYYNPTPVSKFRTHRIANARNECIKIVYSKFPDYPYFIMMDFDDVCSQPVKIDVLKKYLQEDTWDALSFNKIYYYDIWALSIHPFIVSYRHLQKKEDRAGHVQGVLKKSNGALVPCMSAFNGFAIYRASKFVNCHYDGILRLDLLPQNYLNHVLRITRNRLKFTRPGYAESSVLEDCEHRSFHMMAINKNQARIMIAPEILF